MTGSWEEPLAADSKPIMQELSDQFDEWTEAANVHYRENREADALLSATMANAYATRMVAELMVIREGMPEEAMNE